MKSQIHLLRKYGLKFSLQMVYRSIRDFGLRETILWLKRKLFFRSKVWNVITKSKRFPNGNIFVKNDIESISIVNNSNVLVSILIPTWNTPAPILDQTIESVRNQNVDNWELVIHDDSSSSIDTINYLKRLENIYDSRIKIIWGSMNSGISSATNSAFSHSKGELVVFLDHDDLLTRDCILELTLNYLQTRADFIYSDEDKLGISGEYFDPHFKPDWSPQTIFNTMYIGHVSAIRREIFERVNGLNSQYDGCQDWDLILRVSEIPDVRISHVSKILYHWRVLPGSIAESLDEKPGVALLSKQMREQTLRRRMNIARVRELQQFPNYFNTTYSPNPKSKVSIIIPTRDNLHLLRKCISSIERLNAGIEYEIIVVDNGSKNSEIREYLEEKAIKRIFEDIEFNFSRLCNVGAEHSNSDFLLFLNDDTEVIQNNWLRDLTGLASVTDVGAVGPMLLYPQNKRIQHAGILNLLNGPSHSYLNRSAEEPGYFLRLHLDYNMIAVTGACLMISHEKFRKVGGFSEEFPIAYNDVELCLRLLENGYYNVFTPSIKLFHHESVSRGADISETKQKRLIQERAKLFELHAAYKGFDPYFNPNFDPLQPYFEVDYL
ncbi:GT_2_like_c domain containing protein [Candidatus Nanopelagicaceae bacterium]